MTEFELPAPKNAEPEIIYEDKNFIGISKPAGLLVHPVRDRSSLDDRKSEVLHKYHRIVVSNGIHSINEKIRNEPTLAGWLVQRYPEIKKVGDNPEIRPGIVHRLDRETSGVMLVPRTQEYFEYFKNLFKTRQIKKTYLALVSGEPKIKEGVIDKPIGIKNGSIKRSVHSEKMKKNAVTKYKVKRTFIYGGLPYSLLEVYPETGRTHQIRVHLASIGHPIAGDKLYGGKKHANFPGNLMLHAYSIEFSLPNGSRLKLEAEPRPSFAAF